MNTPHLPHADQPHTPKVFCVGMNKTGTTSLDAALTQLGYRVAPQEPAELMIHDWAKRDFNALIAFCQTADAFQDIPFSLPYTYQALDMHFPNSKFILTIRASSDEWYRSICCFMANYGTTAKSRRCTISKPLAIATLGMHTRQ